MRHGICSVVVSAVLALGASPRVLAQTVVWSENFNNGCTSNCEASTLNGWTIRDNEGGTTGSSPNNWFISCAEEGVVPPGCGSSCVGDASLHIGSNAGAGGDMAASFNDTGAINATYRMAVSPRIDLTGEQGLYVEFDFIAYGSAACSDDRAQLRLSFDDGATWPVSYQYCLNSVCCGACNGYSQGQWTLFSLPLPAQHFNNNPNVRIGFHWRNNGNGSGTDPSVAIDDLRISRGSALDPDGDGWPSAVDNCPGVANIGQENADGDAFGDACDACPNDPTNLCPAYVDVFKDGFEVL